MSAQAGIVLRGRNPDVLTCIANLSNDEVFTPPEFAGFGLLSVLVVFGGVQACLAHYMNAQGEDDAQRNHDVEIRSRDGEAAAARAE